jgi:hypothetical protein
MPTYSDGTKFFPTPSPRKENGLATAGVHRKTERTVQLLMAKRFFTAAGWARWLELRLPGDWRQPLLSWIWPVCFVLELIIARADKRL